jgi:tetratricopeptide (TPR) repeat protein
MPSGEAQVEEQTDELIERARTCFDRTTVDEIVDGISGGGVKQAAVRELWRVRVEAAASAWLLPPEEGMLVVLHSLSKAELNGQRAWCGRWDSVKERFAITLASTPKPLAVKAANLRRAPPKEESRQQLAIKLAHDAAMLCHRARSGSAVEVTSGRSEGISSDAAKLMSKAEKALRDAEQADAASPWVHMQRSDLANMRGDREEALIHARRACANPFAEEALRIRMRVSLANALVNVKDYDGAVAQGRKALAESPNHAHANFTIGDALQKRGNEEDAMRYFRRVALSESDGDGGYTEEQLAVFRAQATDSLSRHHMNRVSLLASECKNEEMLTLLDKVAELQRRVPAQPQDNFYNPGHVLAYRAIALCRMGRVREAEAVATRAARLTETLKNSSGPVRPLALRTLGEIKERMGDENLGDETSPMKLYGQAKELYWSAFKAGSEAADDAPIAAAWHRIQAKMHPDVDFTPSPIEAGLTMAAVGEIKGKNKKVVHLMSLPPRGTSLKPETSNSASAAEDPDAGGWASEIAQNVGTGGRWASAPKLDRGPRVQVGERVRVVAAADKDCEHLIRETGVLIADDGSRQPFKVLFEESKGAWWFYESDLEVISARYNLQHDQHGQAKETPAAAPTVELD